LISASKFVLSTVVELDLTHKKKRVMGTWYLTTEVASYLAYDAPLHHEYALSDTAGKIAIYLIFDNKTTYVINSCIQLK
jgi:hypothetical protein